MTPGTSGTSRGTTVLACALALIGFAANSLLCRMALGTGAIDAWSFTGVRLGGGALALVLLVRASGDGQWPRAGSWTSAVALFLYAACFSLAYRQLSTGVGALVLFAAVQGTMIGWGVLRGERPTAGEWLGLVVALGGLSVLALSSSAAHTRTGLVLMLAAGASWGVYSLRGRGSRAPLAATADNFLRSVPLAAVGFLLLGLSGSPHVSSRGLALALASGALASGLGYSLWYLALPGFSATRAALVQLLVPVLATGAGMALLDEHPSSRQLVSGVLILGGVGLALGSRRGP